LVTAVYSLGQRWRGHFESFFEAIFLDPPVFPTLESAKAFYRWCFWEVLRRPDLVFNQTYVHSVGFYYTITFLILSSSASLISQLAYLCYNGTLYSSWDQTIYELFSY